MVLRVQPIPEGSAQVPVGSWNIISKDFIKNFYPLFITKFPCLLYCLQYFTVLTSLSPGYCRLTLKWVSSYLQFPFPTLMYLFAYLFIHFFLVVLFLVFKMNFIRDFPRPVSSHSLYIIA